MSSTIKKIFFYGLWGTRVKLIVGITHLLVVERS